MADVMTTLRSGRVRFRDWRRSRPFWGGALLAAAGIELLVAPAAQSLILPIDLIIYAGIAGISGNLIGVLLIGIGVLSWFQPGQNSFFGMVGIMLALVSFVTSNFGGFVIGMLLGIVGGALVFAWGPSARKPRPEGRHREQGSHTRDEDPNGDDEADEGDGEDTASDDQNPSAGDEAPGTRTAEPPSSDEGGRTPKWTRLTGIRRRT